VAWVEEPTEKDRRGNLILVDGPSANSLVRAMSDEVSAVMQFGDPHVNPGDISLTDLRRSRKMRPTWDSRQPRADYIDYGTVILHPNPINRSRTVLIIAGGTGVGTERAAFGVAHDYSS
jgi:hypothetical protein